MAKKPSPKVSGAAPKKAPAKKAKAPTAKSSSTSDIETVCTAALNKLRELNLDMGLQGEIEWCLGSYANDGNPIGLYNMAERALSEFTSLAATQPKAVPAKLLTDLKKIVKARP